MTVHVTDDRDWGRRKSMQGSGLFTPFESLPKSAIRLVGAIYARKLEESIPGFIESLDEDDLDAFHSGDDGWDFGQRVWDWTDRIIGSDLRKRQLPYSLVCDLAWNFANEGDADYMDADSAFARFAPREGASCMEHMGAAAKCTLFRYAFESARRLVEGRLESRGPGSGIR